MKRTPIKKGIGRTKLRRNKEYQRYLGSKEWQALRQLAFKRDGGLCQCKWCIAYRACGGEAEDTRIEIYIRRGKVFGFDTHHTRYPADVTKTQLSDVVTMKREHHARTESLTGKRRAYLLRGAE